MKQKHDCHMFGDCKRCGHSVMYHLPLAGCLKCDCDEFSVRVDARPVVDNRTSTTSGDSDG